MDNTLSAPTQPAQIISMLLSGYDSLMSKLLVLIPQQIKYEYSTTTGNRFMPHLFRLDLMVASIISQTKGFMGIIPNPARNEELGEASYLDEGIGGIVQHLDYYPVLRPLQLTCGRY